MLAAAAYQACRRGVAAPFLARTHGSREHAHEQEPEGGHAGAADADVQLDAGPVACGELVPRRVGRTTEVDEEL